MRGWSRGGRFLGVLSAVATWLVVAPVWAGPAEQAAADVLFNDAQKLIKEGRVAEACPKLAEAHRLDPTPGTLLNLGDCYERIGKTASAYGSFDEAEALAKKNNDATRLKEAEKRKGLVLPKLVKVTIHVPDASKAAGLVIKWDDQVVGEGRWETPFPVDPGDHMVEAAAPGRQAWRAKAKVEGSGTTNIDIPRLQVADRAKPDGAGAPAPYWNGQRIGGVATMGIGAGALLAGVVTGALTMVKSADVKKLCDFEKGTCVSQEGLDQRDSALVLSNATNGLLIGGGVLLATGIIVFATAPKAAPPASFGETPQRSASGRGWVTVKATGSGVLVQGAF